MMHSPNPLDAILDDMSPESNVGEKVGYAETGILRRGTHERKGAGRRWGAARRAFVILRSLCKGIGEEQRRCNSPNIQQRMNEPLYRGEKFVSECSCLTALPGPALVLLKKNLQTFFLQLCRNGNFAGVAVKC